MKDTPVWTFFYGSYINQNVLKEVDLVLERVEVVRLSGFDIKIRPLANLLRRDNSCVYGIVATATHDELRRLYAHAENVLGGTAVEQVGLADASTATRFRRGLRKSLNRGQHAQTKVC